MGLLSLRSCCLVLSGIALAGCASGGSTERGARQLPSRDGLPGAPAIAASTAPLPVCLQASNRDAGSGSQQFRFDGEGRLQEHRTFLDGRELARDHYTWSPDKLVIEGGVGHIEVTLGAHGEALVIEEGNAKSTLVWEGTFAPAKGVPNVEGIYAISSGGGSRHLPQDTTARGLQQRMGAFRFTGKVSVKDVLTENVVVSTYEDGRVTSWETKRNRGQLRWTPDGAPEQETVVSNDAGGRGGGVSELVYERRAGHTIATHFRVSGYQRDVAFTWGGDGQLAKVESRISEGPESLTQTVLLGPCTEGER